MRILISVVLLAAFFTGFSQIETDRPDFTESPNVVPKGALQIETGFILETYTQQIAGAAMNWSDLRRNTTLNTTLFRYGLTNKTELRFNYAYSSDKLVTYEEGPGRFPVTDSLYDPIRSLSPAFVGIKTNLYKSDRISVGLLGHIYLPWLATENAQASFIAPEVLIPCSIDITEKFGIAFLYGLTWDGETANPTTSYTLALGYGITDALSFYVEPYGFLTNSGEELHLINGGFTYLVNDNIQLDLTGGLGLNDAAPDNFIGCGASFLIQKNK